jgi:stringent starvation protein B
MTASVLTGAFGGKPTDVFIPMAAVLGVYARENGQGMAFENEENDDDPTPEPDDGSNAPTPLRRSKPSLKVVK